MSPAGFEPTIPASQQPQTARLLASAVAVDTTSKGRRKWGVRLKNLEAQHRVRKSVTPVKAGAADYRVGCQNCGHPTRRSICSSEINIHAWLPISRGILRDRSVAQAVTRIPLTAQAKFQSQANTIGASRTQTDIWTSFTNCPSRLSVPMISPFYILIFSPVTGSVTILATESAFQ